MVPIRCVFYEKSEFIRRYLRRFRMGGRCPHDFGDGYQRCCDAQVHLDDIRLELTEEGYIPSFEWNLNDERWPKVCSGCGAEFPQEKDDHCSAPWQVHVDHLYRDPNGNLCPLRELPVGAIWEQDFGHGPHSRFLAARYGFELEAAKTMELPHIFVRTPGGVWDMDTISTNGDGWEVRGELPNITASPSILHAQGNRWHGWLRDGVLTEC